MKRAVFFALMLVLLLMTLTACGDDTQTDDNTDESPPPDSASVSPSETPPSETPSPSPSVRRVSDEDIMVDKTPVSLTARPEFAVKDKVTDAELISPHGYLIGMTFAETQGIWAIPRDMIDYAKGRLTQTSPSLYIYVGNMAYDFRPETGTAADDFDKYVLKQIYYGETAFCESREPLSVLRDIELDDMIADALKSLPGNRSPRKWKIDQLYGEYEKANSASLEFFTGSGFYELKIYGEKSWARLSFGYSGRLWIAEVNAI